MWLQYLQYVHSHTIPPREFNPISFLAQILSLPPHESFPSSYLHCNFVSARVKLCTNIVWRTENSDVVLLWVTTAHNHNTLYTARSSFLFRKHPHFIQLLVNWNWNYVLFVEPILYKIHSLCVMYSHLCKNKTQQRQRQPGGGYPLYTLYVHFCVFMRVRGAILFNAHLKIVLKGFQIAMKIPFALNDWNVKGIRSKYFCVAGWISTFCLHPFIQQL